MTDILKYVRNTAIVAGVFLTGLTEANAQSVEFGTRRYKDALKAWKKEYKGVSLDVQKDSLYSVVNRVFVDKDFGARAEAYVRIADDLNIHLTDAKAPYRAAIQRAKSLGQNNRLRNLYQTIDQAENDSAHAFYINSYNATIPNYLSFIKAPQIRSLTVGPMVTPQIQVPQKDAFVARSRKEKKQVERRARKEQRGIAKHESKKRNRTNLAPMIERDGAVVYDVVKDYRGKQVRLLNKNYLFSLLQDTYLPSFVRSSTDKARYYAMTMNKIEAESGFNPVAHNKTMKAGTYGLTQIDMGNTYRVLRQDLRNMGIHADYPAYGEKITEKSVRNMLVYNYAYDENVTRTVVDFERKRKNQGMRPVLGQTVLVKAPRSRGGKKEYHPVTLDHLTVLSAMQAGPLMMNHFAKMIDDFYKTPEHLRQTPVPVFDKLFAPHHYTSKIKWSKGQDFNKFLLHAPQDPQYLSAHKRLVNMGGQSGYPIVLASYYKSQSLPYIAARVEAQKDTQVVDKQKLSATIQAQAPDFVRNSKIIAHPMKKDVSDFIAVKNKTGQLAISYGSTLTADKLDYLKTYSEADRRRYEYGQSVLDLTSNPLPSAGAHASYKLVA
jgi:hypothetical protein